MSLYQKKLESSFVLDDLKKSRHFLDYLSTHKEFINDYPHALKDALVEYFEISDRPKRAIRKSAIGKFKSQVNLLKIFRDFTTMLKIGI